MKHWLQLAPIGWIARPGRTLASVLAIALGVAMVVWITGAYESVRGTVTAWVWDWIGRSHLTIESPLGKWGSFPGEVAAQVRGQPGVQEVTTRLWWAVYASPSASSGAESKPHDRPFRNAPASVEVELNGIEPETEYRFRDLAAKVRPGGRPLRAGDRDKIVLERSLAVELGSTVGDRIGLHLQETGPAVLEFDVVGIVDRRRISRYQPPAVWVSLEDAQTLLGRPGYVTTIDVVLKDGAVETLAAQRERFLKLVRKQDKLLKVSTAEAKLRQLENAMGQLGLILALISCVAFMTSFFIILSTLSMGLVERLRQLGMLRCVGLTRWQLCLLVPAEVLPLGVIGVALGVPIGFGLMWGTVQIVPEYLGQWSVSRWGVVLACGGGLVTTLFGAAAPTLNMLRVSPLAASRPELHRHGWWVEALGAAGGSAIILGQYVLLHRLPAGSSYFVPAAVTGQLLLYLGYALFIPGLILLTGPLWVRLAARALGVRWQLLRDQVTQAAWRSAAICAGLMVGLSLMVALWIHSEGIVEGWQFPKEFPEAYVYTFTEQPIRKMPLIARQPGVAQVICINEFPCVVDPAAQRGGVFQWLAPFQRFVAADPAKFPELIRLEYLEGNEAEALAGLKEGGHVILTREFSQTYEKHVGDSVEIQVGDASAVFTVVGVVASPAIDIAVSFFGATGELQFFSVGSVIGTFADAHKYFGRRGFKLLLLNFDLPSVDEVPASFTAEHSGQAQLPVETDLLGADEELLASYEHYREQHVLERIEAELRKGAAPLQTRHGSVRVLKQLIDSEFRHVTRMLSVIPVLSLLVAALGVANLMTANVSSRQRQIAVLRAVGATKWQTVRLVVGEAVILAALGSLMGILLGFHLAANSNYVTEKVWGFQPVWVIPWRWVIGAIGITSLACLLAGIAPARHAARNNIVSAMQAT